MATQQDQKITIKDLLEAGAHFGHQKQRWNPKMKRFIFEERNGIYIIDLAKTMQQIRKAKEIVQDTITKHKSILFVGTKKQAKGILKEIAQQCGEFYVCERWLGGMLTNLKTIRQSVKTLERIEKRIAAGGEGLTKKEISQLTKEQAKLNKNLAGIRGMRKPPGLLIVVDPGHEHIAVAEANTLKIPVMALIDTNCDPDPIDHVIACNDDALKCVKLILSEIGNIIMEKKKEMSIPLAKGDTVSKVAKQEAAEEAERVDIQDVEKEEDIKEEPKDE